MQRSAPIYGGDVTTIVADLSAYEDQTVDVELSANGEVLGSRTVHVNCERPDIAPDQGAGDDGPGSTLPEVGAATGPADLALGVGPGAARRPPGAARVARRRVPAVSGARRRALVGRRRLPRGAGCRAARAGVLGPHGHRRGRRAPAGAGGRRGPGGVAAPGGGGPRRGRGRGARREPRRWCGSRGSATTTSCRCWRAPAPRSSPSASGTSPGTAGPAWSGQLRAGRPPRDLGRAPARPAAAAARRPGAGRDPRPAPGPTRSTPPGLAGRRPHGDLGGRTDRPVDPDPAGAVPPERTAPAHAGHLRRARPHRRADGRLRAPGRRAAR